MNKAEVAMLLKVIKKNYPGFDASGESVEQHLKYLRDFPYQTALSNVDKHILTERFPPNIADIRGRVGEQVERRRMRQETTTYFEQLDNWKQGAVPPPAGLKEALYAKLRSTNRD